MHNQKSLPMYQLDAFKDTSNPIIPPSLKAGTEDEKTFKCLPIKIQ